MGWPNVDAVSGCLLKHFQFTNQKYYTMLFGMGRSLGVLSALTWSRAFVLPIERPKSVTIEALKKKLPKLFIRPSDGCIPEGLFEALFPASRLQFDFSALETSPLAQGPFFPNITTLVTTFINLSS